MRELDGQNDGLFQRFFCSFETCDVFPPDVGLLCEDGACECAAELLRVGVLFAVFVVPEVQC